MLKNYIKIAFRNMMKQKTFSFINLFGLTTGLASFLLIGLYIFDELTYDRFHEDAGSIYRVVESKTSKEGKETKIVSTAFNISEGAKKSFPEVKNATRFGMLGRTNVSGSSNTNVFYESYYVADENFLKTFDFPVLQGNPATALEAPHTVVITDETAVKMFGTTNVVGKSIQTDRDSQQHKITAVLHIPDNSHLKFNLLFSEVTTRASSEFMQFANNDWNSNSFVTYLKLNEGTNAKSLASKIDQLVSTNRKGEDIVKSSFTLQPLTDIHFYSAGLEGDMGNSGNIMHMYVFGIVAFFVLLIACINYMNLTTARFAGRSKEIAVRKVAGASQQNLVKQFLTEASILTFISLALSLLIVKLVLPYFNAFAEKSLALGLSTDYRLWLGVLLTAIFVGLLSGVYPAFFQARLKPLLLLKNKINIGKGNLSIRRSLVVFQFALSIIMIVATIIVYQQMKYVDTKDMGFKKEQLVVVDINSGLVRAFCRNNKNRVWKNSWYKKYECNIKSAGRMEGNSKSKS